MILAYFEALCRERLDACLGLMCGAKNEEYSRNDDKLHNFKRAGALLGCSPERALLGMMTKHLVSVMDIVDDIDAGRPAPGFSMLSEKMNDSINYLLLLEALIVERLHAQQETGLIRERVHNAGKRQKAIK